MHSLCYLTESHCVNILGRLTTLSSDSDSLTTPPPIPAADHAQVWLDFDGTITRQDVLDQLIYAFAENDSWKLIEERWQAGLIGSYECLKQEFAVLRVQQLQLDPFLETIEIDSGFASLLASLQRHQVPVAIVSDGIDRFIQQILARLPAALRPRSEDVRSNSITFTTDGSLQLDCPHREIDCESGAAHCKCASIAAVGHPARQPIYVGDGRSDLCPARKISCVFAKNTLAKILQFEGRSFHPFATLHDVAGILEDAWNPVARP